MDSSTTSVPNENKTQEETIEMFAIDQHGEVSELNGEPKNSPTSASKKNSTASVQKEAKTHKEKAKVSAIGEHGTGDKTKGNSIRKNSYSSTSMDNSTAFVPKESKTHEENAKVSAICEHGTGDKTKGNSIRKNSYSSTSMDISTKSFPKDENTCFPRLYRTVDYIKRILQTLVFSMLLPVVLVLFWLALIAAIAIVHGYTVKTFMVIKHLKYN